MVRSKMTASPFGSSTTPRIFASEATRGVWIKRGRLVVDEKCAYNSKTDSLVTHRKSQSLPARLENGEQLSTFLSNEAQKEVSPAAIR